MALFDQRRIKRIARDVALRAVHRLACHDVKGLAQYLRDRGENTVSASVWGFEILGQYGIRMVDISPSNPNLAKTRYAAVGASFLNGSVVPNHNPDEFAAYRQLKPEKVIGGSIYVYRVKE